MAKYRIFLNEKNNCFFIKKKINFLFIKFWKIITETIESTYDTDRRIIYFSSVEEAKIYIEDVLEYVAIKEKLIEEVTHVK